jgi:hypothetical protein
MVGTDGMASALVTARIHWLIPYVVGGNAFRLY